MTRAKTLVTICQIEWSRSLEYAVPSNSLSQINDSPSRYKLDGATLTNREAFLSGYSSLIERLTKINKRVVFVLDVAHLKNDLRHCVQRLLLNKLLDCRLSYK